VVFSGPGGGGGVTFNECKCRVKIYLSDLVDIPLSLSACGVWSGVSDIHFVCVCVYLCFLRVTDGRFIFSIYV